VVINEVDYDQVSTDTAEFFELKNVSASAIDLDAYVVELVNGNAGGALIYDTINLPDVSVPAGDYFVVCANATTVVNCDLVHAPATNSIQNGGPDAVGLRNGATLVDALSYEGDSGAPYTEGSGTGLEDDPAGTNGLSRCPDGIDTDVNNVDFRYASSTPGTANDCPSPPTAVEIAEIQGASHTSPLVGQSVQTTGSVTALRFSGGTASTCKTRAQTPMPRPPRRSSSSRAPCRPWRSATRSRSLAPWRSSGRAAQARPTSLRPSSPCR
jgi:predicted extracellular nuclease